MPKFYDSITDNLRDWALEQQVFFTASAPSAGKHINVSPKGLPSSTFTIFDPNHAAYIDATGSGAETISHVYENGRITIMFCSFAISPRIMRFFCTGRVVEWDQPSFAALLSRMAKKRVEGARAIILLDVWKVQTSCGFGVPYLTSTPIPAGPEEKQTEVLKPILKDRETMGHWASKQVEADELRPYQRMNNAASLDGLTGLRTARKDNREILLLTEAKATYRRVTGHREPLLWGMVLGMITTLLVLIVPIRGQLSGDGWGGLHAVLSLANSDHDRT